MADLAVENEPEKNQVRDSIAVGDSRNGGDLTPLHPDRFETPHLSSFC